MIETLTQKSRVTDPSQLTDDAGIETSLRPNALLEYIGQNQIKKAIQITLQAAKVRQESPEPILLYGPPGLGKTTLASVIAKELGGNLKTTSGPILQHGGDLAAILSGMDKKDVLFIDEIHRLPAPVEEILYPVLEEGVLDILIGKGVGARSLRIDIPKTTFIGATTKPHMLSQPLRDRFGHQYNLEYYTEAELTHIIKGSAKILRCEISDDAANLVATRSRFTPRIANRLLKRVRDVAQVNKTQNITKEVVLQTLTLLNLDSLGLDKTDRMMLSIMIERFKGGPVGIESVAASCGENADTLSSVHEPFLLQTGLIVRTPQGRKVTQFGYQHLNKPLLHFP